MSTHPNVILMLAITPDDLTRKTLRAIQKDYSIEDDDDIKIGSNEYHMKVMEEDYDEGSQIKAKEGDIVLYDLVTYGYGEVISWEDLDKLKCELDEWAKQASLKYNFSYKVFVSANYW